MINFTRYATSAMLMDGCKKFAIKANTEDDFQDILNISQINIAALIFGYTSIEVTMNEIISLSEVVQNIADKQKKIKTLLNLEKKQSIKEKYDGLAIILGANNWDSSIEPFQSFEIIQTIRNEIIHHKGKWRNPGEVSVKKIKFLLEKLDLNHSPKNWESELFMYKGFGQWVFERVSELEKNIKTNLLTLIEQ